MTEESGVDVKDIRSLRLNTHRQLVTAVLAVAVAGTLGIASPAQAEPKGARAVFAQCPTGAPAVTICTFSQTTSGEVAVGKTKVPINRTITLQGGGIPDPFEENSFFLAPAKNGESISKTALNVPGGLLNIINCEEITGEGLFEKTARATCKATFESGLTGVTATTELVANEHNPAILNAINILSEKRTGLVLPVRIHLKNPFLGSGCYIGSAASPIELRLTSGTTSPPPPNKPITGKTGGISLEEESVLVLTGNTLVDNSFSVPTSSGCGEVLFVKGFLDSIVDGKLGLPSAGGNNTAILSGTVKTASVESVIESES